MRCSYCGVEITDYPSNGICVCCGGKLPPRPAGIRSAACGAYSTGNFCSVCGRSLNSAVPPAQPAQPVYQPVQPVYIPVSQQPLTPGVNCCPKCHSAHIVRTKRGFRWGLGILGFFLIPGFGIFLGFCGSKQQILKCASCGRKWKGN